MRKFTHADNELLHRVYETHFADGRVGRKIAGDISRLIARQAKELIKLKTLLENIRNRAQRDSERGLGLTMGMLWLIDEIPPKKKEKKA